MKKKIKHHLKKYKSEFKKTIDTALFTVFGVIIAVSWKEVLDYYLIKIEEFSSIQGKLISAVLITGICVLLILIIRRFTKKNGR